MPNHVANRLQFFGPKAAVATAVAALAKPDNPKVVVDFNQIRPMPEELKNTIKGSNDVLPDDEYEAYLEQYSTDGARTGLPINTFGSGHPISQSMARDYRKRFGAANWYDWANENWATKWGAYDTGTEGDHTLYYNTAWSCGAPDLYCEFSQQHPQVTLVHEWADEDSGHNTGRCIWRSGELFVDGDQENGGYHDDNSKEAWYTCFMLKGNRENYRRTADGGYAYYEQDEEYRDENTVYASEEEETSDLAAFEAFELRMQQEPDLTEITN